MAVMHPAQSALEGYVMDWCLSHPEATKIPAHLESTLNKIKIYDDMAHANVEDFTIKQDPYEYERIKTDLLLSLEDYSKRRDMEQELAIYIDRVGTSQYRPDLYDIAERLMNCRLTGAAGMKPDGGQIIAWDNKCGLTKLCPDESRENTQRLTEFYLPELVDFKKEHFKNRLFYSVLTIPNVKAGELLSGKKEIIEKFKNWVEHFENIKGSLIIQEDPLSAHDDWNVHLNVFLCVQGAFDYKYARAKWGFDVEFSELKGEPQDIREALLEAIKYSAQIVNDKSHDKSDKGLSAAPAMVDWSPERFVEWFDANKSFRRVRNYGCLYNIHKKRWNKASADQKKKWIQIANESIDRVENLISKNDALLEWKDIQEPTKKNPSLKPHKTKLRRAMTHGEPFDISLVQWVGAVNFGSDGVYSVGSVLGDNFLSGSGVKSTSFDFYNNYRGGG